MKHVPFILFVAVCFLGCNDDITSDFSPVNSLKIYDSAIQRVKKIHNLFALIDTSKIIFLDEDGNRIFDFSNREYKKNETIDFRLTDVVSGAGNDIFILGAEILRDSTFQIYVFKVTADGQSVWSNPVKIDITRNFDYEIFERDKLIKSYFFISENGYALGNFNNSRLYLIVNYQSADSFKWYYKLLALDDAGKIVMEGEPMQEFHPEIWNYMVEFLPNGNLLTSLAVGSEAYIHQFDPNTFELLMTREIDPGDIKARLPIFTNMLILNEEEVVLTGHANKENNLIVGGNFDAFFVKYNFITNAVTDTLFNGANNSYELTYHSYIDANGNIQCIGTKREDLFISHGSNSNLYKVGFNLNSSSIDSLILIENKGYEGLYFEPVENSGRLKVLGRKLDISGHQNKQAFFTIINP